MRKETRRVTFMMLFLGALALGVPALAEEPQAATPASKSEAKEAPEVRRAEIVNAVFPIRYASVAQVASVLQAFRRTHGGTFQENPELRVIAVSGPKEMVNACDQAIKKLDVPALRTRNVELTFYLLNATRKPAAADDLPAGLKKVCEPLGASAGLGGFRLLDTVVLRAQEDRRAEEKGLLAPRAAGGSPTPYEIGFDLVQTTAGEKETRIHLRTLTLDAVVEAARPGDKDGAVVRERAGVKTDVEFGEGQMAVVGVTPTGASDALVLIVTGKATE